MSVSIGDLALYAGALFVLFLTPGPVWLAVIARSVSGGFRAAWPLALGVACGDILWPLTAVVGMSWLVSEVEGLLGLFRWVASLMFIVLGVMLIRHAGDGVQENRALTRPGTWAGFLAGVAVILSNPKAVLFYMGLLPGFFDLSQLSKWDIAAIVALSFLVPLLGNLAMAGSIHYLRTVIANPAVLRRINLVSAVLLIGVGLAIPLL
ncbi:LysE family translocator [Parasedimentitalea maritima]|uniref:LysE family transporter n=1 Tax=Parasedimentitalea maritima TaxID=2578117 RepID=A0A6A4RFP1_9RHOB|nr:LysE family translocator [Zongyanglinia marina]KAE9632263.1 LysE family transporter [Zongyanglinia marina]